MGRPKTDKQKHFQKSRPSRAPHDSCSKSVLSNVAGGQGDLEEVCRSKRYWARSIYIVPQLVSLHALADSYFTSASAAATCE